MDMKIRTFAKARRPKARSKISPTRMFLLCLPRRSKRRLSIFTCRTCVTHESTQPTRCHDAHHADFMTRQPSIETTAVDRSSPSRGRKCHKMCAYVARAHHGNGSTANQPTNQYTAQTKQNNHIMKSMIRSSTASSTSTTSMCTEELHLSVSSLLLSSPEEDAGATHDVATHNVAEQRAQAKGRHVHVKRKKAVKFNEVEIFEFPYMLGDNPSVSLGPPISMAHTHQDRFSVDLIAYDDAKENIHRRSTQEMRMDQMLRTHILQSSGHSLQDIMQATMEAQNARELRHQSVQSSATCGHLMFHQARTTARRRIQSAQTSFSSLKQCNFAAIHRAPKGSRTYKGADNNAACKNQEVKSCPGVRHHRDSITTRDYR